MEKEDGEVGKPFNLPLLSTELLQVTLTTANVAFRVHRLDRLLSNMHLAGGYALRIYCPTLQGLTHAAQCT